MDSESETPMKIIFLPFPTPGHMLPMADLAKTFSSQQGVECIIITTHANAPHFQTSTNNPPMTIHTLTFPGTDVGLPADIENFSSITSSEMRPKLFYGISMLRKPAEDLIREIRPDCIVSDMYFPWTSDLASEMRIPRVFQMASIFSSCCAHTVKLHAPHEQVVNDDDLVTMPSLPHKIEMKKSQLPGWIRFPNEYTRFMDVIREAELKSYGALANTFCDVEKEYEECYYNFTGLKVWNLGPLCLRVNRNEEEVKLHSDEAVCWRTCLEWLGQKKPNSVLYVSFGSLAQFSNDQLQEIAAGLETSGHDFIWALKKKRTEKMEDNKGNNDKDEQWSVDEFRKKLEASNKGLIIEGWAPQLLILKHQAIGGMVTHCGWNTVLEGVSTAGVPLVTWPLFAEQFYNERLVVHILKIGVAIGASQWCNIDELGNEIVSREKVNAAIRAVMGNDKGATEMRQRAKELSEACERAVHNGGSSQANLVAFLDELKTNRLKAV